MEKSQMMKGVSKEDRNPIVMDIHYKTKSVNIKAQIRAKMIMVKDYYCPTKGCANENFGVSKKRLNDKCYVGNKIICPACKTELLLKDKRIIKLYTTDKVNKNYINLERFLSCKTMFNFKKNNYGQIASFMNNIDDVNRAITKSKERVELNETFDRKTQKMKVIKGIISSCKITPLTWEALEKKWERVKELRLVEAI